MWDHEFSWLPHLWHALIWDGPRGWSILLPISDRAELLEVFEEQRLAGVIPSSETAPLCVVMAAEQAGPVESRVSKGYFQEQVLVPEVFADSPHFGQTFTQRVGISLHGIFKS